MTRSRPPSAIDSLLRLARIYAKAERIELSTVSWRVFGDTKKLTALVDGRDIQLRRYERALRWFSGHWPTAERWPGDIPRPPATEAA